LFCSHCERDFPIEEGIPQFISLEELSGLNRRFARFYDLVFYIYDPFVSLGFLFVGGEEKARREVLERLEPAGGRLLEVSIGTGSNLPYLIGSPDVGEVYGLDISLGQLRRCRSRCRKRGWPRPEGTHLFLGTAEQLPFRDESFDGVLHVGGINFFSDKGAAIREMIRVAKAGTKIVIADETEEVARGYDRWIPSFTGLFGERREAVTPPVDLVPPAMQDVRVNTIWRGKGYCLELRKPRS
jgi:ubiquinone/menaquinone biosynthesis C-methylase UbiE